MYFICIENEMFKEKNRMFVELKFLPINFNVYELLIFVFSNRLRFKVIWPNPAAGESALIFSSKSPLEKRKSILPNMWSESFNADFAHLINYVFVYSSSLLIKFKYSLFVQTLIWFVVSVLFIDGSSLHPGNTVLAGVSPVFRAKRSAIYSGGLRSCL